MIFEVLSKMQADFFVMYASSRDANFYYATKMKLHDAAIYLAGIDGTELLVVPRMERRRAERESRVKEIATFEDLGYMEKLKELGDAKKAVAEILTSLIKEGRGRRVLIPHNFPAFLAFELSKHFEVDFANPFAKLRIIKRSDEIEKIRDVANAIVAAFDWLVKNFNFKTCEDVRRALELKLFSNGYLAEGTIVSSGKLSADPHEIGKGRLEKHAIIDVFPRSTEHLYYADFTRTIFFEDSEELREMYSAVVEAQKKAIEIIRDGVDAKDVHTNVKETLESYGFKTSGSEGFIHSTGHGIGLEVHEEPRISEQSVELKAGMVVTVEPGLYYKDIGGVRVEDTVVVKRSGCEVLTKYPSFVEVQCNL